jgi:hypothetical protein
MLAATQSHVPIEVMLDFVAEPGLGNYDPILFEKHLAACAECSEQMELVAASFGSLEPVQQESGQVISLAEVREKKQRARAIAAPRSVWQYAAIAACLLFTFALGYSFYSWRALNRLQAGQIAQAQRINALENESQRQGDNYNQSQQEIERLKNNIAEKENRLTEKDRELARQAQAHESERRKQPAPTPPSGGAQVSNPRPEPQANVVALDVFPATVARSAAENQNRLIIPRQASSVTLILNSQNQSTARLFAIELRDAGGRVGWRNNNLRRYTASDFTINIPAQMLRTGNYTVNIFALDKGQKLKIETYQIGFTKN